MRKNSFFKYFFLLTVGLTMTSSCERDDLCSLSFDVTPMLIIEFYDINEPESLKPVQDFAFVAVGASDTINIASTSELRIPLRNTENTTSYLFTINASNPETLNVDELQFNYRVSDVYVNRACGFRGEFLDFQAIRRTAQAPETNWIRNLSVQQSNIRNENQTHLYIFH